MYHHAVGLACKAGQMGQCGIGTGNARYAQHAGKRREFARVNIARDDKPVLKPAQKTAAFAPPKRKQALPLIAQPQGIYLAARDIVVNIVGRRFGMFNHSRVKIGSSAAAKDKAASTSPRSAMHDELCR